MIVRAIIIFICFVKIIDACVPWTFGDWHTWSSCSSSCGGGTRKRVKYSCVKNDEKWEDEKCNEFCYNGGQFVFGTCMCSSWRSGHCCQDCKSIYIPHCKGGRQSCGGSPDNVKCNECYKPYYAAGWGNGCRANLVCPRGNTNVGNTCYTFHNNLKTWSDARSWCRMTMGSDLLVVRNDHVYNDIEQHIPTARGDGFWLGATDRVHENDFRWIDGSKCCPDYWWLPGEPNDLDTEDCLIFYRTTKNGFNDLGCDRSSSFICEHQGF